MKKGGELSLLSALLCCLVALRLHLEIDSIQEMEDVLENGEILAGYPVIPGELADRRIEDRHSAAHRAIVPIVPEIVEGQKEEPVPAARLVGQLHPFIGRLKPFFVGIFPGELVEPAAVGRLPLSRQMRAEGV